MIALSNHARLRTLYSFLGFMALIASAVLVGAALAVYPKGIAALVGAISTLLVLMMAPAPVALLLAVVACYFLAGPLESLARIDRVFWISYIAAGVLGFRAIAESLRPRWSNAPGSSNRGWSGPSSMTSITWNLILWVTLVGCASVASVLSTPDPFQLVLATRDYFWLWGAFALVVATCMQTNQFLKVIRLLPWVVVLQVPLVLYQRYAVSAGSVRSWDAVVGLFGGNPDGGGASGSMGAFSVLMAVYTVLRARSGLVSPAFAVLVCVAALISVGLAEVKFVPFIAPVLVLAMLGVRATLGSPRVVVGFLFVLLCSPLVLYGYWKSFEQPNSPNSTFEKYVQVIVERNLDERPANLRTVEMGRLPALSFWWRHADPVAEPIRTFIGHGIGSTRIGIFPGEVVKRFRVKIARSSAVVLLWEVGVIGFSAVMALLLMGTLRSAVISRKVKDVDGELYCALRLAVGVLLLAMLYLPYNTDLVGTPQTQLLVVLSAAVLWAGTRVARERA